MGNDFEMTSEEIDYVARFDAFIDEWRPKIEATGHRFSRAMGGETTCTACGVVMTVDTVAEVVAAGRCLLTSGSPYG